MLVTQSFLDRFPSTDTNAHRHTVSEMSKRFIGLYIPLLASRPRKTVSSETRSRTIRDVPSATTSWIRWPERYKTGRLTIATVRMGPVAGYSAELLQVDRLYGRAEGVASTTR